MLQSFALLHRNTTHNAAQLQTFDGWKF